MTTLRLVGPPPSHLGSSALTVASHPPAPSAPCGPFVSPVGGEQRRPPLAGRRWGREAPWRGREHRVRLPWGSRWGRRLVSGCEWRGSAGPRGRGPGGCRPAGRCPGTEQDGSGTRRPGRARGAQGGGRPLRLLSLLPGAWPHSAWRRVRLPVRFVGLVVLSLSVTLGSGWGGAFTSRRVSPCGPRVSVPSPQVPQRPGPGRQPWALGE